MIGISGLLTSTGKTSREDLKSKEPAKFTTKMSVNSRCNKVYQK
jgi:DNA primase